MYTVSRIRIRNPQYSRLQSICISNFHRSRSVIRVWRQLHLKILRRITFCFKYYTYQHCGAEIVLFFCSDSGSTLVPKLGSGSCHILPLKNFGSGSSSRSQIISAPLAPAPQHCIKSPYNMWKIYSWNMLYIRHYTLIEIIFFIVNLQLYFYYQTKILNFVTPIMTYFM